MKYPLAALMVLCAPQLLLAEDTPAMPAPTTTQTRFFPVNESTRSGHVSRAKKQLRSDSSAMSNGFFRIDRGRTVPMNAGGPLIIRTASAPAESDMPRIIRGPEPAPEPSLEMPSATITPTPSTPINGDPILSLFAPQAASGTASFREALTGTKGTAALSTHQWPIPAQNKQRLSSSYGFRADPFDNHTAFHSGIDIAAPLGTPVLATADGTVSFVGTENGYGRSITLSHPDGSESKYSHLSAEKVRMGEKVKAGQEIGSVGSSGRSTGPHLDYSLRQDGVTLDPIKAMNPQKEKAARSVSSAARSERLIVVR